MELARKALVFVLMQIKRVHSSMGFRGLAVQPPMGPLNFTNRPLKATYLPEEEPAGSPSGKRVEWIEGNGFLKSKYFEIK